MLVTAHLTSMQLEEPIESDQLHLSDIHTDRNTPFMQ